jgi:hypothetical protein
MRRTFALTVAAALLASITLGVTGVALSSLERKSVERSLDARLLAYVKTLVANLASADQRLKVLPQSIGEPLFELPLSGWYWQITALDVSKPEIRSSRSLWNGKLARLRDEDATTSPDGVRHGYAIGPEEQRLRLTERTVDLGVDGRSLIQVAGDAVESDDQMRFFHETIAISFGFLATLLALVMFFQARLVQAGLARQAPLEGT